MYSIKTRLSLTITFIVLISVLLVSLLANYFIDLQFKSYIEKQQNLKTSALIGQLNNQYDQKTHTWNVDSIHSLGMSALYDGYVIKVYDANNQAVWDATTHDMGLCNRIINDITKRMEKNFPGEKGKVITKKYNLLDNSKTIGYVDISFYGPYFLSENDFKFLNSLNIVLLVVGLASLLLSVIIGYMMAKKISSPILNTVGVTKQISDGNLDARISENTNMSEINLLINSINHLADSLQNQEKIRKQLTADVSHELRTPITTLQTHIEAMVDHVWEPTTERLQSCYEEVERIGKLVNDLENLAKADSNNLILNKIRFNLTEVTAKVLNIFETNIKSKNIRVNLTKQDIFALADKDRIIQVIHNLVSNAVKYSKQDGNIDINIFETAEAVVFNIKDSGIGIEKEELHYIFERFYRTEKSRNKETGGSGIGLAIVKSIIESHGGKVTVESIVNQGTCFEFTLPKN